MGNKKILIISRTIFPLQFPRSLRATELAKELARQGHDVTLYAVLGTYDYSQFEIEHGLKIKNIGRMTFAKVNSEGSENKTFIDKILARLLDRILDFPDIELMFKIPSIIKKEKNVDLLITIAKPFSIHWGAALAKVKFSHLFPKVWAADCGDPYMGNQVINKKIFFYFEYLEKWFCKKCDYIVVPLEGAKDGYYNEFHHKIKVIPQGFAFDINEKAESVRNTIPTFAYAGVFYKGFRDPTVLLQYLTTINRDFKFIIYTKTPNLVLPFLNSMGNKIEVHDYIPREELLKVLRRMDFLVNLENGTNVQSPSKLIDYALTKRPILSLNSNDISLGSLDKFLDGNYEDQFIINDLKQYQINNVAEKFISLTHK